MDDTRCFNCNKRLMAMTDRTGRTELVCLKCNNVDPMKTDAVKWANSSLADSALGPGKARAPKDHRLGPRRTTS
jgi:phage FluMu protein Com